MRWTNTLLLSLLLIVACSREVPAPGTTVPRGELAFETPEVLGADLPAPPAPIDEPAGFVPTSPAHSERAVKDLMYTERCGDRLLASTLPGKLLIWRDGSEVVAALILGGRPGRMACGSPGQLLVIVGSALVQVDLDQLEVSDERQTLFDPLDVAQLASGQVAVLEALPKRVRLLRDGLQERSFQVSPNAIAIAPHPRGGLAVLDVEQSAIHFYDATGQSLSRFARSGQGDYDWAHPVDLTIWNDHLYVTDARRSLVFKHSLAGEPAARFGDDAPGVRGLALPTSVAIDEKGLWIASRQGGEMRRYQWPSH